MVNDLNLFFISEPSETTSLLWRGLDHEIERDERICRKLVWLKGKNGCEVADFFDRTFFARPWEKAVRSNPDALHTLIDDLDIPETFLKVLLDEEIDGEELVEAMMSMMGGKRG